MLIQEVIDQFIFSRKHGTAENSKGKAAEKTLEAYRYTLGTFCSYMEESRNRSNYEHITPPDIRAFVEWATEQTKLAEKPWSASRYLLVFKALKVFFRWIEQDEDCQEMNLKSWRTKMPRLFATPRRDYIPSPQELKEWKKAFTTTTALGMRNWAIFCLLFDTGLRREELAMLKLENIQLDNRQIYVPDGKTGSRTISISERVAQDLRTYLKRRQKTRGADTPYLFPSCKGDHGPSPDMISKVFRRMRKRLGLSKVTPHTLRHAFTTYYIKNGGNVERLRDITGHRTYAAMQHYMHLAQVGGTEQKDEIDKVSPLKMLDKVR
jgi:integrase/recombinase XerD